MRRGGAARAPCANAHSAPRPQDLTSVDGSSAWTAYRSPRRAAPLQESLEPAIIQDPPAMGSRIRTA